MDSSLWVLAEPLYTVLIAIKCSFLLENLKSNHLNFQRFSVHQNQLPRLIELRQSQNPHTGGIGPVGVCHVGITV